MKFPGFEVTFPATNRSIMIIAIAGFVAFTLVVSVCSYEVFNARPEALEEVGEIIGGRKPEKVSVRTDDGIETIEVCPPCPLCEDYVCPACPTGAVGPEPPAVVPETPGPSMIPSDTGGIPSDIGGGVAR
jgi:hypothetical protein